jgi:hypothetical protein
MTTEEPLASVPTSEIRAFVENAADVVSRYLGVPRDLVLPRRDPSHRQVWCIRTQRYAPADAGQCRECGALW